MLAIVLHALALGRRLRAPRAPNRHRGAQDHEHVVPGTELCFDTAQPCTAENRQVSVHLWYPADRGRRLAVPNAQYKSQLHAATVPAQFLPLSWKLDGELARENAAIDPNRAFPVIVFSHGGANDPIDYAYTLERIAARGFIVAAPYHTNNTQDDLRRDFVNAQAGTTVFACQDGRPTPCSRGGNVPLSMADRVRDIDRVLDELPGWFGDRVDVGRAGVLGHSAERSRRLPQRAGRSCSQTRGPLLRRTARTATTRGSCRPTATLAAGRWRPGWSSASANASGPAKQPGRSDQGGDGDGHRRPGDQPWRQPREDRRFDRALPRRARPNFSAERHVAAHNLIGSAARRWGTRMGSWLTHCQGWPPHF